MNERLPPGLLAKSFLVVAVLYIGILVSAFLVLAGLVAYVFPSVNEVLMDADNLQVLFETSPEKVFPTSFVWSMLAIMAVVCLVAGWCAARFSPFAHFPHAIFLAALIFVSMLQQAVGAPSNASWMFLLPAAILPCAVLFGARLALSRNPPDDSFKTAQD